jgi:hypothetical protein
MRLARLRSSSRSGPGGIRQAWSSNSLALWDTLISNDGRLILSCGESRFLDFFGGSLSIGASAASESILGISKPALGFLVPALRDFSNQATAIFKLGRWDWKQANALRIYTL